MADPLIALVAGSGIGIATAANRYPWLHAAMCYDVTTARLAREHNDAHVLALGACLIGLEVAYDCLSTFPEHALCRGPPRAPRGHDVGRAVVPILPPLGVQCH
jgi:RpiB/LacA/LacB family sugar-phosphate isomerase